MDKGKQLFTYESIDDDIDQLLNNLSSPSSDLDARLVYELRHIYKEDTKSLNRVFAQLESYSRNQYTSQEISIQTRQRHESGYHTFPFRRSSNTKHPANRLSTVLAAAIVGLFLVSSLAWILAMTHPPTPGAMKHIPANLVALTVHNDKSGKINYIMITDGNKQPLVPCQAVPPLQWVDVLSESGTPVQVPAGQIIRLQYFHSPKCDLSSRFLFVDLPIPIEAVQNHCWFNPDNITTPNWSGCIQPSQILPMEASG